MLNDKQGRVVRYEGTRSSQFTLERGDLPRGAYVLQVRSCEHVIANRIVLVE